MIESITCPVCGYGFTPSPDGACGPCPLHTDCSMACCPNCGHSTINPRKSTIVRWIGAWLGRKKPVSRVANPRKSTSQVSLDAVLPPTEPDPHGRHTALTDIPPGAQTRVRSFAPALSPSHRLRLQAFGVEPGRTLQVIQQHPVTIVQVDHTDLAVEKQLAERIICE